MSGVLHQYLALGAILFVLGAVGFLVRRNLIVQFLSAELMLQGVAINFVAFGRYHHNMQGQAFVVFLLTVAACEAAIALALVMALYQQRRTLDGRAWSELAEMPPSAEVELPMADGDTAAPAPELPRLAPAGPEPILARSHSSHEEARR